MHQRRGTPKRKRRTRRTDRLVIWSLLLCFPAGLFLMWTDRCRWPRAVKSGVSLFIAAALAFILGPYTQPPERPRGGIEIVSRIASNELYGPPPTENFRTIEVYTLPRETDYHIVADPTPTPTPIYVYANDGGKYYHTETCRYTKNTTPKVKLSQAVDAAYKPCVECNPPVETN